MVYASLGQYNGKKIIDVSIRLNYLQYLNEETAAPTKIRCMPYSGMIVLEKFKIFQGV
jgi:hypothetical protein